MNTLATKEQFLESWNKDDILMYVENVSEIKIVYRHLSKLNAKLLPLEKYMALKQYLNRWDFACGITCENYYANGMDLEEDTLRPNTYRRTMWDMQMFKKVFGIKSKQKVNE